MNSDSSNSFDDNQERQNVLTAVKDIIWKIPRKLRIVLSIILVTMFVVTLLNVFKPEAQKRTVPETVVRVDVVTAQKSNYPIVASANGTIEAETRGNLVAQIRGEVVSMADNFKTGGSFKAGDVLIQIDPRDYQAELSRAAATLSQADASYRQERANAKQARDDWERLGNTKPAPDLVLRKPQLAAAKAQLDSARAAQQTAQLNLSRTQITAPYSGRIIRRDAVLGQYLSVGTPIAEVFSTDGVEVRLPISQDEYTQLGLDKFDPQNNDREQFDVLLSSTIGGQEYRWEAEITRTDSTFDLNTRQIDVIAKVVDPFGRKDDKPSLKIGQFVNARIQGRTVEDVFVIPNKSIREGSYTYVVRDGRLAKQNVNILWQDDKNTLVSRGLSDNELVVTTSLNSTLAGALAKLPEDFNIAEKTPSDTLPTIAEEVEQSVQSEVDVEASAEAVLEAPQLDATPETSVPLMPSDAAPDDAVESALKAAPEAEAEGTSTTAIQ